MSFSVSSLYLWSHAPDSSWQTPVVSVTAADAFNPIEWAQNSCLFLIDWSQDGTSPRLEESAQKMLAETVCFHMEDFGEARSLLESLKEKAGKEYLNLISS